MGQYQISDEVHYVLGTAKPLPMLQAANRYVRIVATRLQKR